MAYYKYLLETYLKRMKVFCYSVIQQLWCFSFERDTFVLELKV